MWIMVNTNTDVFASEKFLVDPTKDDVGFKQDHHIIKTVNEQHSIEDLYGSIPQKKIVNYQ